MEAWTELLGAVPAFLLMLIVVVPRVLTVVLTLVAGLVAVLSRDPQRCQRALAVLKLVHASSGRRTSGRTGSAAAG